MTRATNKRETREIALLAYLISSSPTIADVASELELPLQVVEEWATAFNWPGKRAEFRARGRKRQGKNEVANDELQPSHLRLAAGMLVRNRL